MQKIKPLATGVLCVWNPTEELKYKFIFSRENKIERLLIFFL